MFLYLAVILGFGVLLLALVGRWLPRLRWWAVAATMLGVTILSVIFDNLIVGLGIVDYDPARILGIRTPIAPIEDYGYAIFGAVFVPAVWHVLARLGKDRNHD